MIELKRGYDLPTKSRSGGPFPVVSSSGITGSHAEFKVPPPGVVTGRYGTIGRVFYLEEPSGHSILRSTFAISKEPVLAG